MQQEEIHDLLSKVHKNLKREDLSQDERNLQEKLSIELAAASLSFWLPRGVIRKILMLCFVFAGVYGLIHWSLTSSLLCFAVACIFSPRIIGEIAMAIGRYKKTNA